MWKIHLLFCVCCILLYTHSAPLEALQAVKVSMSTFLESISLRLIFYSLGCVPSIENVKQCLCIILHIISIYLYEDHSSKLIIETLADYSIELVFSTLCKGWKSRWPQCRITQWLLDDSVT